MINSLRPGARLNMKMSSYQYTNCQCKDKTVSRPSYLYNGNPMPGKTVFILRQSPGANELRYYHDDVIKWKHFPRHWPFVLGIHRSPMNSLHKGRWRKALMFLWSTSEQTVWVNNRDAGGLRRHGTYFDATAMHTNPPGGIPQYARPAF